MRALAKIALTLTAVGAMAFTATAGTLEDVKERGVLRCVVSTGIAGFAYPDSDGTWKGFDIDFCRATAAAVLGDSSKIKAITSTGKTRFTKLNSGEGDVLWRNTTITFSRETIMTDKVSWSIRALVSAVRKSWTVLLFVSKPEPPLS